MVSGQAALLSLVRLTLMAHKFFDITFTQSVKAAQEHYGSRRKFARSETGGSDFFGLTDAETEFISQRDGFYMATVGEDGYPYIQFRGGPQGFLKILDENTLGFADFRGNLQYISIGNLHANDRAALLLMDYANRRRLKILARVQVTDAREAPELIEQLAVQNYQASIERAMILRVEAFDWNCPQHITERFTIEEIRVITQPLDERIKKLEAENQRLRGVLKQTS
jgi:predicted pyridoxine 5'-phosphate oxidase superfamily flavin-nucleotide-binding protein